MAKWKDIKGLRVGRLTVIRFAYKKLFPKCNREHEMWECVCECGKKVVVDKGCLTTGTTTSCGCYHREKTIRQMTTHGHSNSKLHNVWLAMRNRCKRKKDSRYKYYGGKGISVCEEWQDFSVFYAWAIAKGWREGLTIDRIDNMKGYNPENCRIADIITQANNKTNNTRFLFQGIMMTAREISEITHINSRLISARMRHGWLIENAARIPPGLIHTQEDSTAVKCAPATRWFNTPASSAADRSPSIPTQPQLAI